MYKLLINRSDWSAIISGLFIIVSLITLGGCVSFSLPERDISPIDLPERWANQQVPTSSELQPWLKNINDPKLEELINRALTDNFDLKSTAARVKAAMATAKIRGGDRLPEMSAELDASRQKRNSSSGFRITDDTTNSFGIGINANWEIDLWGKLANEQKAALFDYESSKAELEAARLSLAAKIAKNWFDAIETDLQVKLAEKTLLNFRKSLTIIEEGFSYRVFNLLDVRLARANVAEAESLLASQKIIKDNAIRTLEVLLGNYPAARLTLSDTLPLVSDQIPAGLPSQLLERRPDLIQSQRRLAAADQRLLVSKKSLLPEISLTGSAGTSTRDFSDLLNLDFLIWSIAANITQRIFQGGKIVNDIERAEAVSEEALAEYAQSVLVAFQEIETTLRAETLFIEQEQAMLQARNESIEAENLAQEQYIAGLVDIITLLESQRRAYDSKSSLLKIKRSRLINRIDLYLALGGSFTKTDITATQ